ncbi:MAG: extracellular solute-binding protein [Boseongicola sp. SB0677_bin_26]|nr:extracellular solute-binding protein [Boseongicola sp. SB0665_bin_10]MYG27929.1 extracellular solute-binding protein [Boseongicola sp. SB0677_bin_26]
MLRFQGCFLSASTVLFAAGFASAQEVRLFSFEGYAEPEWVESFEAETGCSVSAAYTGSVDEMFAKMAGSDGADYDLISIDTSIIQRYVDNGLIIPFDMSMVPNTANLLASFTNVAEVMSGGETYGVPMAWGSLGLIYDTEAFPDGVDSWEALWDPANAGHVLALDDANNNVTNAAIVLGIDDPFNLSDEDFDAVKQKLIDQKQYLISYYAGFEEGVNIWDTSEASLMFSMGEFQAVELANRGYDVVYSIPEEGGIGWLDTWALSKGVQDAECAHKWANHYLNGDTGPTMTELKGYGNTTDESPGLDYADKLIWLRPVEDFDRRVQVWNEVKAAQ